MLVGGESPVRMVSAHEVRLVNERKSCSDYCFLQCANFATDVRIWEAEVCERAK